MIRRSCSLRAALALLASGSASASTATDDHTAAMAARLFPLVTAIEIDRLPDDVRRMLAIRRTRMRECPALEAPCVITASMWTPDEIALLTKRAKQRDVTSATVPDDGVGAQLKRELLGLNSILQVYGQGRPPRKPLLDGPIEKPGDAFSLRVSTAVAINRLEAEAAAPVDTSIGLAVSLLDVNDRDEAIAFEPLDDRFNAAAKAYATTVPWDKYPYTAIVVLGNGPETLSEELSPRAKLRVKLAASRFFEKSAPFIIVSGGAVAPRGTRYVEAVEMRKALVERYEVPEHCIIIEPYARYTSTNLRNATRRLHAIGAPLSREALALTDADHSIYVESPRFRERSVSELGYFPGSIGRRLSNYEMAFTPAVASLRVDPLDPLDP